MRDRTISEAGATTPRALGRIVLASLLALGVGLVVLPLSLGFAQGAASIEIVNPNDSSSAVVSDKGRAYELTAWIANLPVEPSVQFQIEDGEGTVVAGPFVAVATTGRPDTFSYEWTIADSIDDGTYSLEATLSSGVTLVDTATQEFTLDQADGTLPIEPTAAETLALSYPVNGGPLGVYVPTSGASSFLIEGNSTAETEEVAAYYSVSATGTDPVFEACGTAEPEDNGDFKIRCEVATGDSALAVSAVAAAANRIETPIPLDDVPGAADGHAVVAYQQFVSSFSLNPETAGGTTVDFCAIFTAELKDQEDRPVAGVNVDVHTQGPNDDLKFDVSGTFSDPNQPPNAGSHTAEPGFVCDENGQGGADDDTDSQGSHTIAGQSSRKHIESLDDATEDAGTDTSGTFTFAVHSPSTGETQMTAWADLDGDDLLCDDEPQDYATIGWGFPAPDPTGQTPDVASCVLPSPSPTASASASGSPTASASPTASPSPTPEPMTWVRSITIRARHKNKRLLIKGRVSSEATAPKGCTADVPVKVQKRKDGKWRGLRKVFTNNDGAYKALVKHKHGRFRALAPQIMLDEENRCAAAVKIKRHRHRR